jgi:Xaa-Pro dipeptidase
MLTVDGCRRRQERLRDALTARGVDAYVVSDYRDVYHLTGFYAGMNPGLPTLFYVDRSGRSLLVCHTSDGEVAADHSATYEPSLLSTLNPDPMRRLARALAEQVDGAERVSRVGWQAESLPRSVGQVLADSLHPDEWIEIDEDLSTLQRRKDPDEIELLRGAIACSLAAYDAAKATIAPGVTELAVHEAGHTAATLRAGEPVFHSGDYQSGQFGGPARNRPIEDGELYIIDAWTIYQGYWSDLCRTFPVGKTTPLQREIYDLVADILREVPNRLKPGMRGTQLWHWIDGRLREHPHLRDVGYLHHGGHAVGVRGHEQPDLNRDREGIMEPGVVVSCEPGAYTPELNAGIRLENTFLITENGCELLSDYPLSLG